MFFHIKHRWYLALIATLIGALLSWRLGAWGMLTLHSSPFSHQLGLGLFVGILSLGCDGVLHEIFKRAFGRAYLKAFHRHGTVVLGDMRWREYITGGLMAALAEEPLFRGVLLPAIDNQILGVAAAAFLFATCHWLRLEFLPFWFWAMFEGAFFGACAVIAGSLLVAMIAHGIHDVVGYRAFQTMIRGKRYFFIEPFSEM
jgi:membrane protease YdiL (CAAX protease family)